MSDLLDAFWEDVGELEAAIAPYRAELLAGRPSAAAVDAVARFAHTLKASAAYIGLSDLEVEAHALARAIAGSATELAQSFATVVTSLGDARRALSAPTGTDDHEPSRALSFAALCAPLTTMAQAIARTGGPRLDVVVEGGAEPIPANLAAPLREALIEGVRNAARHGVEPPDVRRALGKPERGVVTVSADLRPEGLVITIADDGAGLDAAKLAAAAAARGVEVDPEDAPGLLRLLPLPGLTTAPPSGDDGDATGAGLGLAILADTARRLGGRLDIETKPGKGLTLRLVAPLDRAASPADGEPRRVLVIEDDAFFRAMLTPLLEAAGYRVTAIGAASGAWALTRNGARFDAVVADLDAAAGEGLAFATAAAADPEWAGAARLGLTTHLSASAEVRGAFHDTIAKTDRSSLLAALSRARRAPFAA